MLASTWNEPGRAYKLGLEVTLFSGQSESILGSKADDHLRAS